MGSDTNMGSDTDDGIPMTETRNPPSGPPYESVSHASAGVAEGMPTSGPPRMQRLGLSSGPPYNDADDP